MLKDPLFQDVTAGHIGLQGSWILRQMWRQIVLSLLRQGVKLYMFSKRMSRNSSCDESFPRPNLFKGAKPPSQATATCALDVCLGIPASLASFLRACCKQSETFRSPKNRYAHGGSGSADVGIG